jgi:CheY-like chemotaxis protein
MQSSAAADNKNMVLGGLRVLVVEDAVDIREVLMILLRAEGAQVVGTGSGQEATKLASQHRFDAVLSDIGLPDVPGDAVIRQIRTSSPQPLRVIAITGFGEPHISRARQAGADIVLSKPVDWQSVVAGLRASFAA